MDVIVRGYVGTFLDDFDKDGQWYVYCDALSYEDKDEKYSALEKRFINYVKERVDENGKKK